MAQLGPLSGKMLASKYVLIEILGAGGMGSVYKARDIRLNRLVAVKEMIPPENPTPQALQVSAELFHREAQMLAGLKHQHLPHIYDHFDEAGHWVRHVGA